ncbi:MAG: hypothetical protein KJ058_11050 [Thermoanaerobaculia bacterium]|nr:hypothetical protein [Thermoanaerobaculia bacterium]
MSRRVPFALGALLLVLGVAPGSAQPPLFATGFEWGDLGDWAGSEPARCDRLDAFGRGLAPASEIHVATSGSNATGDGSPGNPFATIGRAAQVAVPGSAIRVHPGTYAGGIYLSDLAGSESAPIWIGGLPGAPRPVIEGGTEGLHLTRGKYLVIHDLEVRDASANGINADDGGETGNPFASHHLTFVGLHVHSIGGSGNQDCLKLSGVSDFTVALSEFASCGGNLAGSGVDQVGCHRGLIARNRFHDLSANAIQTKGGSSGVEIRWNRFVDSGARSLNLGGSTGFSFFRPPLSTTEPNAEARDLVVVANLFVGSDAPIAYVGCVGCVVAQNTIVDPGNWILRILQETVTSPPYTFEPCRDGVFANNLVYFNRGAISTHLNIGPNTAPATFTFASNLWYAWDAPAQSQPALPSPETNGLYGVDPELGPGYRIGAGSPAAGTGAILPWGGGDLDGACFASPPSRGAFEAP